MSNSMLCISEAASLALHTMRFLATRHRQRVNNRDIARTLKVSETHLAKVLQRLGRAGLVLSLRGPGGGFTLTQPPESITLLKIYEAIEGPQKLPNCLRKNPICAGDCIWGDLLPKVSTEILEYLTSTKLSDLNPLNFPGVLDEKNP